MDGLLSTHKFDISGAQGRNRTTDTAIFSRMLYQLSYLGAPQPPLGDDNEAGCLTHARRRIKPEPDRFFAVVQIQDAHPM